MGTWDKCESHSTQDQPLAAIGEATSETASGNSAAFLFVAIPGSVNRRGSSQVISNRKLHSVDLGDETAGGKTVVDRVRLSAAKQGHLLLKPSNTFERRREFRIASYHSSVSTISTIPRRLPSRFVCQKSIVACSPPNAAGRRSQKTLAPKYASAVA